MRKKIISLLITLVMVVGLVGVMPVMSAGAASKNVINTNVSSSAVTKNATDGKLPSAATIYAGNSYYYNIQVSSDLKVKTFKLYVKDVGQSKYTCAFTDTAKNYMRYTSKKYAFSKTGTVYYYWKLTYTNGKTKTTPEKSIAVKNATVINTNVASSRVGTNATDGKLPSPATLYVGNSYYFNIQVSNDLKVKKFQLYVKDVGKSSYSRICTHTADNYMRYTSKKYTFAKAGNISYYWQITYTNGKTQQTSAKTIKVNKPIYSNLNWPCASSNAYKVTCVYYYKDGTKHSTRYGYQYALDISGGGNIVAAAAGTVETVAYQKNGFGNYIVIKHANGKKTLYAHLSSVSVKPGNPVSQGQKIGVMGSTGNSGGTHLHFEYSGADPWKTYFKDTYKTKISYESNVYSNNNKYNSDKTIVNWIKQYYKKNSSGYYVWNG